MTSGPPWGVTSILQAGGLSVLPPFLSPEQRAFILERGRLVHALTEDLDRGVLLSDLTQQHPSLAGYLRAYEDALYDLAPIAIASEQTIQGACGLWRGRLDRIWQLPDEPPCIVDLKCGGTTYYKQNGEKSACPPATGPQLAAYRSAFPPTYTRAALILRPDGRHIFQRFPETNDDERIFSYALALARWRWEHGVDQLHELTEEEATFV